ncbi:MAG TPA: hypothetical protein V6D50_11575 [Chroococcales cyanobacterium]
MTGKVIDSSATGILILLIPLAFLSVLLYKAWPVLLALFVIIIGVRIWQQYQWKRWSKQVNPYFNQLIEANQGCLTALDLSMKASLSGPAAQRYLDKKAEEFGAQRRNYADKGTVYYFLTASALESLFEDIEESLPEQEDELLTAQATTLIELPIQEESKPSESELLSQDVEESPEPTIEEEQPPSLGEVLTQQAVETDAEPHVQPESVTEEQPSSLKELLTQKIAEADTETQVQPEPVTEEQSSPSLKELLTQKIAEADTEPQVQPEPVTEEQSSPSLKELLTQKKAEVDTEPQVQPTPEPQEVLNEKEDLGTDLLEKEEHIVLQPLIQAELAKRLDVHSSTVGKRKSDPDFADWSQSRDPEGLAWVYSPETKEFMPQNKAESAS